MAYFLFIDESGQDHKDSPYEVLAGVSIQDTELWKFVAYLLSWNFRMGELNKPGREELNQYIELIKPLRYRTTREIGDIKEHVIWSVTIV